MSNVTLFGFPRSTFVLAIPGSHLIVQCATPKVTRTHVAMETEPAA